MNRREFLKKSIGGVVLSSIPLISGCEKNPVSYNGYGAISIKTEKSTYIWQQEESNKVLHINSILENSSKSIYYSNVGDGYNSESEQDFLFIAGNSAGCLEKYDAANDLWYEAKNLLGFLYEGSKFVFIKPSKKYSLRASLHIKNDAEEKGKYRFRIDYYNNVNQDVNAIPLRDYSNTFLIKLE